MYKNPGEGTNKDNNREIIKLRIFQNQSPEIRNYILSS